MANYVARMVNKGASDTRLQPDDVPTTSPIMDVESYRLDEVMPKKLRGWRRFVMLLGVMMNHVDTGVVMKMMEEMRERKAQEALDAYNRLAKQPLPPTTKKSTGSKAPPPSTVIKGKELAPSKTKGYPVPTWDCQHPLTSISQPLGNAFAKWWTCLDCGSRWERLEKPTGETTPDPWLTMNVQSGSAAAQVPQAKMPVSGLAHHAPQAKAVPLAETGYFYYNPAGKTPAEIEAINQAHQAWLEKGLSKGKSKGAFSGMMENVTTTVKEQVAQVNQAWLASTNSLVHRMNAPGIDPNWPQEKIDAHNQAYWSKLEQPAPKERKRLAQDPVSDSAQAASASKDPQQWTFVQEHPSLPITPVLSGEMTEALNKVFAEHTANGLSKDEACRRMMASAQISELAIVQTYCNLVMG